MSQARNYVLRITTMARARKVPAPWRRALPGTATTGGPHPASLNTFATTAHHEQRNAEQSGGRQEHA